MERDLDDQVTNLFPLDGPYSPERTIAAANSIAELVRYLNHATLLHKQPDAMKFPAHLARVIGSLQGALGSMPQLFRQLAEYAGMFADAPGLYADNGADPVATAEAVIAELNEALRPVHEAFMALNRAHAPANRLGIRE